MMSSPYAVDLCRLCCWSEPAVQCFVVGLCQQLGENFTRAPSTLQAVEGKFAMSVKSMVYWIFKERQIIGEC